MVLWEEPIFREEARLKLWKAFTDLQILFLRKQKFIPDTIFQPLSVMKRGTIHLYKISILFDNREFEHDIYELIRAFYPEAEIAVSYEEEDGANTADLLFRVEKQEQSFIIRYQNESNTGGDKCRDHKRGTLRMMPSFLYGRKKMQPDSSARSRRMF